MYVWNLSVPSNAVINTPNSYLKYKVKMAMKDLTYNTSATATNGIITNYGATTTTTHGRYYVKDNAIFFQSACFTTGNAFLGFAPPVAVSLFPMNSSVILNSSEVIYGNVKQSDENIFQQRTLF